MTNVANDVVVAHRGLIAHLASRYAALDTDDLIQEASIVILTTNFPPERYSAVNIVRLAVRKAALRLFWGSHFHVRIPPDASGKIKRGRATVAAAQAFAAATEARALVSAEEIAQHGSVNENAVELREKIARLPQPHRRNALRILAGEVLSDTERRATMRSLRAAYGLVEPISKRRLRVVRINRFDVESRALAVYPWRPDSLARA